MLGKKYIKLNGIAIPNPVSNSIQYENVENVNTSEAGSDLINVSMLGKRRWNLTCNCSSYWKNIYEQLGLMLQTTMEIDDEEIDVRVRINSIDLVENSEHSQNTDGLWEVSLTISEFERNVSSI